MVVLTEEFHGMSLKRKGGDEPGFFDDSGADDRSSGGFSLSCRATKMRRLACPDGPGDQAAVDAAAADGAATGPWEDDDVAMGEGDAAAAAAAAPSTSPGPVVVGGDDERAVVVYGAGDGDGDGSRRIDAQRLRADWVRAMLREADSRTVLELLAGAALARGSEPDDLALAVVPWVAPAPAPAATEEAEAPAEDGTAAAAMDVEGDEQEGGRPWAWTGHGQAQAYAAGEGVAYRWPQHCWEATAAAPAVAQASPPVMWSW